MYRTLLFILCSTLSFLSVAQDHVAHEMIQVSPNDTSLASLESMLKKQLGIDVQLIKTASRKSPVGIHEQFQIYTDGLSLYRTHLKRNRMSNGSVWISLPKERITITSHTANTQISSTAISSPYNSFKVVYSSGYQYLKLGNFWSKLYVVDGVTEGDHVEKFFDQNGRELGQQSLRMRAHRDTTVQVQVFAPDPLTTSNSEYGESIEDLDDNLSEAIVAEYAFDSMTVRFDSSNNAWSLVSNAAQAVDIYPPFVSPPTSTTGNFDYDRNEPEFEYVNAFFHINRQKRHLQSLGFDSIVNYSIEFDAHGDDDDQSFFDPITLDEGQLIFGDGGVDDAEDADVIIHEYGHAVSYSAAPATVFGGERQAIEEGLCDYFALAYSRELSPNQPTRIFNWDGHNEYWNGRELTYSRTYPSDLQDELYLDAPIWSSALADIHDYYGRTVTETLLLNSMYSYFGYMSMVDAGALLLQTDSLMYGGEHVPIIKIILCKRGLLEGCQDTTVVDTPLEDPYVGGHKNFSAGTAPLYLYPNDRTLIAYSLFDLKGNLIDHQEITGEARLFHELEYTGLQTGFYILSVKTTEGDFSFKLLKQNN